jgi:hypothetical protein
MFLTKGTFDVRVDNPSLKKNKPITENRTRSLMQLSRQHRFVPTVLMISSLEQRREEYIIIKSYRKFYM